MVGATVLMIGLVIVLLVIVIALMTTAIVIIQPHEQGIYLRMGRFVRVLTPGVNIVPPLVSEVKKVDMRPRVLSISYDDLLASDRSRFMLTMKVHFRVTDSKKAYFETPDCEKVVGESAATSLRLAIRNASKDEVWTSSRKIGEIVRGDLDMAVSRFGMKVEAVELSP